MAQGYYNLTEAAKTLGMMPDELRQMAQKNQIRSFQDRGTLRFRVADIQEMARRRGATSDPDLVLGEPSGGPKTPVPPKSAPPKSAPPKSAPPKSTPPSGGPRSPQTPKSPKRPVVDAPEIFDFALDTGDDKVDIGHEVLSDSGPKSGPQSGKKLAAGSDSDVKLVVGASGPDSDVKLVSEAGKTPKPQKAGPISPTPGKSSRLAPGAQGVDSGVRLVTTDSDSDVKIVGAGGTAADEVALGSQPPPSTTDSDIRLEQVAPPAKSDEEMLLTEEINLDEELKKQEAAQKKRPKSRMKPKSELKFPTQSPFELSDSDIDKPTELTDKPLSNPSGINLSPATPKPESSGSIVLESNDDFSLELPDDSVMGSSDEGKLTGPSSGINLSNPVDAGISLEEGGSSDQLDLDMSLEVEGGTPKPTKGQPVGDSSSEFELSLDAANAAADQESDFDLTLDDSGEKPAQAKAGAKPDKDIFETDFEVPALEGDSGSEVAALETGDTELESSDFDLALDDSDLAAEDESGSQVVALDEESADEAAETLAGELGEEMVVEEGSEEEVVTEGPVREVVREKIIEPAPWGAWPTVFMLPCVIVMVVVGLMGFELIQSNAGFRSAGFVTKAIGDMVGFKTR